MAGFAGDGKGDWGLTPASPLIPLKIGIRVSFICARLYKAPMKSAHILPMSLILAALCVPAAYPQTVNIDPGEWETIVRVNDDSIILNNCVPSEESVLTPTSVARSLSGGLKCKWSNVTQTEGEMAFDIVCPAHSIVKSRLYFTHSRQSSHIRADLNIADSKGRIKIMKATAQGKWIGPCSLA